MFGKQNFILLINEIEIFFFVSGYLKDKTVLLVTHQLQYLSNVDKIIILENVSNNV
jgi:ABC-type transport system involved in cytochrome bd biosynthesis fused ATPase/permease subunit